MKQFLFRDYFYECCAPLTEKKDICLRLAILDVLCEYGIHEKVDFKKYHLNEKEEKLLVAITRQPLIAIQYANERYKKAVINGRKGGRPRKNKVESQPIN